MDQNSLLSYEILWIKIVYYLMKPNNSPHIFLNLNYRATKAFPYKYFVIRHFPFLLCRHEVYVLTAMSLSFSSLLPLVKLTFYDDS